MKVYLVVDVAWLNEDPNEVEHATKDHKRSNAWVPIQKRSYKERTEIVSISRRIQKTNRTEQKQRMVDY